jgi:hypothetical protein
VESVLLEAIQRDLFTKEGQAVFVQEATRLQMVQDQHAAKVAAFLSNAIVRFKALLDGLANVTQLQVDKARALPRVMLGKEIVLHPTA